MRTTISLRQPERRRRTWATTCSIGRNRFGPQCPIARTPAVRLVTTTKAVAADGNEPDQVYSDFAYHSIALPFNRRPEW